MTGPSEQAYTVIENGPLEQELRIRDSDVSVAGGAVAAWLLTGWGDGTCSSRLPTTKRRRRTATAAGSVWAAGSSWTGTEPGATWM